MFLHGDFSLVTPASLLQTLGQERRSVRIAAWRGESEAVIDMLEGVVVAARCHDLHGEEAVFQFAVWECGQFLVRPLDIEEAPQMAAGWEELLLEGARRRDELELTLAPLPAYPTRAQLEQLLAERPALSGVAMVGQDGRILGAIGMDEDLAGMATVIAAGLSLVGHGLAARAGAAIYAGGGRRLVIAAHGEALLLGLPAPGASIGDAASQLAVAPALP